MFGKLMLIFVVLVPCLLAAPTTEEPKCQHDGSVEPHCTRPDTYFPHETGNTQLITTTCNVSDMCRLLKVLGVHHCSGGLLVPVSSHRQWRLPVLQSKHQAL